MKKVGIIAAMQEEMNEIKNITVDAPVKIGDIIKHNILNLNVDLIATKNIDVLI